MNTFKFAFGAVLLASSLVAVAAESPTDTSREQRMDDALQRYRDAHPDTGAGPVARAEESMKRGLRKTGQAIKHGAQATGHAVKHGAHKVGQAIHPTDATAPKP
jgi:hypothetical protein